MADIRAMEANVMTIWREQISVLLPESVNEDETNPEGRFLYFYCLVPSSYSLQMPSSTR